MDEERLIVRPEPPHLFGDAWAYLRSGRPGTLRCHSGGGEGGSGGGWLEQHAGLRFAFAWGFFEFVGIFSNLLARVG